MKNPRGKREARKGFPIYINRGHRPKGTNMKSVMDHNFASVPSPQIQRSVFNRTHGHKTTFDSGYLIPFYLDEILPGDTMSLNATLMARLNTLINPIMDNLFLETQFFFVPNRLVWTNWERFQGAQDDPSDSIDYTVPIVADENVFDIETGDLADYFGIPIPPTGTLGANALPQALPFRAYYLIWNTWYRDQNLQDSIVIPMGDGPDDPAFYEILRRGKRHDYFTSCLPWPQKGDAVSLALAGSATVAGDGNALGLWDGANHGGLIMNNDTGFPNILRFEHTADGTAAGAASGTTYGILNDVTIGVTTDVTKSGLVADLTSVTAFTINQLREAIAFQHILEKDARGGTRYVELLKSHFGVTSPDFRLQRPEYLGGSSQRINVQPVVQQSETATTPQGTLAAYSQVGSRSGFNKSFTEHGHVIGIVNVRADITYQNGLNRMWSRRTRYDFYMPSLAHLGEQAVLRKELLVNQAGSDNAVFGYQERWAEYRYKPSFVSGQFRSEATDTLDPWHLALEFDVDNPPILNAAFIVDNPPLNRVIAVPGTVENPYPQIIMDSFIQIKHARPMPVYSIPGLDRF